MLFDTILGGKKIPNSNYEIARMQYNQAIIGLLLFMQSFVRKYCELSLLTQQKNSKGKLS